MSRHAILYVVLTAVFMLLDCMNLTDAGSSVSGNGRITGCIRDTDGTPAPHTAVALLAKNYDPVRSAAGGSIPRDTTDAQGLYAFSRIGAGTYAIEAVQVEERTRALVPLVTVTRDTVIAPDASLQKPGSIRVMLQDNAGALIGYVFIPGTSVFAELNGYSSSVTLDSVPVGTVGPVCFAQLESAGPPRILADSVGVEPGDTTIVSDGTWRYVRKLRLNTTPSGADVPGDVYGFPMLVRLTDYNFDFLQARASGEDIRFAKMDNAPLFYEIERWDPVNEHAEVWVKVDTIHGNDSTQSILMYWGNADAGDNANGTAVFDTAAGFSGVWHLGETGNSNADGYADATANAAHGQGNNLSSGGETEAVVGLGQNMQYDLSQSITIKKSAEPVFDITTAITVSAWISVAGWTTAWQRIISKGDSTWRFHRYGSEGSVEFVCNGLTNSTGTYFIRGSTALSTGTGTRYYITGVYDGSNMYLYVNGTSDTEPIPATGPIQTTDYTVMIGENAQYPGRSFNGVIDEVRVEKIARSADWIKLCYMNQKEPDALIQW